MQEFSSVTASSYDADSLAPMLNEKSADGWSVVAIVSAGTNIVAYLEREARGDSGAGVSTEPAAEDAGDEPTTTVIEAGEPVNEAPAAETTPYVPTAIEPTAVAAEPETSPEPESTQPETTEPAATDEPAGWAAAPESSDEPAYGGAAATESPAVEEPAVEEPAAQEPAATEQAAAAQPESTVPAGWYADPSGRYELRYWDGNAWTEHVSRAGQQFTDPPVA